VSGVARHLDDHPLFIAVDLGAGSGRVFLGGVAPHELLLEEVRRFRYPPRRHDGHLRWDLAAMLTEITAGLLAAARMAHELERPVQSIGVDSWGVDYGLVDAHGRVLEDPVCYRDERTSGVMEQVFELMPRAEIFARTGIQLLEFNTVFQLYAHAASGIPKGAAHLLLIPDLINSLLTGRAVTEFTNATTTQLLNARSGAWDDAIVARLGLPGHLLCEIVPAGTAVATLQPDIAEQTGLAGVRVVAPATHDTGSAVAGAPLQDGWAYISSGTWSLVGVERHDVLIDADVACHNVTNEGGAFGTTRFLKNVMGLWILECCRREWRERGDEVDYDRLLERAALLDRCPGLIYPDDARFLNPPSMGAAIAEQMAERGQRAPIDTAAVTRVILDSLALRYGSILLTIERLTKRKIGGVHIVGGGSQNAYLNQATSTVTGLPVTAGPAEATVTGNVLVQAIAAGRFASLADARQHVARNVRPKTFTPRPSAVWDEAVRCYATIEATYLN
jgi:rhamnulokinase